jgi:hypothetical protein
MAKCLPLDSQDKAALRKLDADFVFSADNETATVTGEMEVAAVRLDTDRFCLTVTFPSGETLDVRIARSQLLEQLEIEADEG